MLIKNLINKVDAALGSHGQRLLKIYGRYKYLESDYKHEMKIYENDRRNRKLKYADLNYESNDQINKVVSKINQEGYAIIKNFVSADHIALKKTAEYLQSSIYSGTNLKETFKDSIRSAVDMNISEVYLSDEECKKGENYLRDHANYAAVSDPLLNVPEIAELAFHPFILSVINNCLSCPPALGGMNLRKSFRNNLHEYDTLYFHVDGNSPKLLKAFFYLNDVDKFGGPFCFVKGSHRKRFFLWKDKLRWTYDEISSKYGKENIVEVIGNRGDLIIADTTGFHRGTKVLKAERSMLTFNYVIHPEFKGHGEKIKFQKSDFDKLSSVQKAACDFLTII
jgi:ectoine hydroxylase-related dioxygenase (phytanoyl-CoA dioxygenase family)